MISTGYRSVHAERVQWAGSVTATTDLAAALAGADYLVLSIPAQSLRVDLTSWAPHIAHGTVIMSAMKGIGPNR
ncbi:hypothetical protein [Streptomyces sp. NPDC056323]|uniref:hypothetical protein n=1 Tax=Streptomyces sp. NPDC056323 TaxID=3345784 RepID=UPI0035E2CDE1